MPALGEIKFENGQGLIEAYSIPEPNSGCWIWIGAVGADGYGTCRFRPRTRRAHRLAYEAFKGDPSGWLVCHTCDNTLCVNPDHLFLGTDKDNFDDMVRKGRRNIGRRDNEYNKQCKFTNEIVLAIREAKGTQEEIGKRFGVSRSHVGAIKRRKLRGSV